jgi:integrase
VTRVFPPQQRCPKPDAWPELDRAAWGRALEPFDPFNAKVGQASRWRASTRRLYETAYGRWLTYLKLQGQLDPAEPPGARATLKRARAYYETLKREGLAPYSIAGRLTGLSRVLTAMEPDADFRFIGVAGSRVHTRARPVKDVGARLQPAEAVLLLGLELMREADGEERFSPLEAAVRYRDGLIIAFLVYRPLRPGNLASIASDGQLQRRGQGGDLVFTAGEMKGNRPFACSWPAELEPLLERYIQVHRSRLLAQLAPERAPSKALWLSCRGRPLGRNDIGYSVRTRTAQAFGAPISPHHFRHLAASTIAADDPEGVTGIATVLHHASLKTSEAHYNKARQMEACRQYQTTVARLRRRRGAGGARAGP